MSGLYIFFLAVGAPLLLWMAFAGDADGGDGFGVDVDGDGPLLPIPLSAIAFFMATFGFIGVVGGWTSVGAVTLLAAAAVMAVLAGVASTSAFKWLRESSSSSDVSAAELEGTIAKVALPVSTEHRGRIIVNIAGAREQMTAAPADGSSIDAGERVVIVRVEGGVALVAPLGPGLELE
jgi:membrane protein implicated in regulation of membrane protease activity